MEEKRKSRWRRRLKWPLIAFGGLLIIVYVILPLIVTPIIRNRLQKQLSTQLDLGTPVFVSPVVAGGRMYILADNAELIALN